MVRNQIPVILPAEPVNWLSDGSPHSPRFNDRYRSRTGGLAQAETVFLQGWGLPEEWRGQSDFTILETGFGLGLNFLATWASWEADEHRNDRLHYCSIEGCQVNSRKSRRTWIQGDEVSRSAAKKGPIGSGLPFFSIGSHRGVFDPLVAVSSATWVWLNQITIECFSPWTWTDTLMAQHLAPMMLA
jgi:hypothetical protein